MKRIKSVKVNVTNMTHVQEDKIVLAASDVLEFFKSDFFRRKLMSTNVLALRGESSSSVSKRLTRGSLYDLFMTGKEEWNSEADHEIDLNVVRYYKWLSKVKGYIIPMKPNIHVNGKYFDTSDVMSVGSNLSHEWSHTLGFRHSGNYIRESIPYLINAWFCTWYKDDKLIGDGNPKPVYATVCERTWWTLWLCKRCYKVVI